MSRLFKLLTPLLAILLVACGDTSTSAGNEFPSSEGPISEISSDVLSSSDNHSSGMPSNETPSSEPPSSEIPSSETSSSEAPSSETPSSETPSSETPSSEIPSSETPSSETPSESSSSPSSGSEEGKEKVALTFNAINYNYGSRYYATGNYGVGQMNGYSFEHYRAVRGNKTIALLPYYEEKNEYEIGGSLTNSVGLLGMNEVTFTYFTSGETGPLPRLYTSETLLFEDYIEFPLSTSKNTVNIPFSPANYFRFEASDHTLELESFTIMYEDALTQPDFEYKGSGDDFWRLNPTIYHGDLYEGASVTVPLDVVKTGNSYTVRESKTYTYYSFDYVYSNMRLFNDVSTFAYTDPVDLAAFFTAFKTWPANYAHKNYFDEVRDIFGVNARQVSSYQRIDGYATTVPWNNIPGQDFPQYYELDLALGTSYYYGERGVGRLVCWEFGFDSPGYDDSPVCVYTDDHYGTFSEYLNNGTFSARFNAERLRTNYLWSAPTTLN